jgi:Regulator of chromosome condensation (RCC1) repeat
LLIVYAWGDNTAGQRGISRRTGIHKVQRVEALWKNNKPCVAIAASEQATLVLAIPDSSRGRRGSLALPVNSIYSWGHGSHVPSKVHFVDRGTTVAKTSFSTKPSRPINPVAISCARYHNVAVTSDGEVYTWGLHGEPLGTKSKKSPQSASSSHPSNNNNNSTSLIMASPQLVKGMLPENGGGIAVAVSACENHTAVLTDTGALYTWGSTHGKNILGHEGVSWQPIPKKVPGVHRAVGVAVAKEHTVLLVGTVFPPIPEAAKVEATTASQSPQPTTLSLEDLAARKAAEYVDLFNVLSVLITAERANCPFLVDYCMEFCRCNLDGVLNVGEKSVLNTYLKEQLMSSLLTRPLQENRDAHIHPLLNTVITTSTPCCQDKEKNYPIFVLEQSSRLSTFQEWLHGCESLVQEPHVANMIVHSRHGAHKASSSSAAPRARFHSSSPLAQALPKRDSTAATASIGPRVVLETSEDLQKEMSLLKNMDLSTMTKAKVEAKQESLTRELRGIRKRIGQIAKLQAETTGGVLSTEQREKLARRPHLETYLHALEPALSSVENKLLEFVKKEKLQIPSPSLTLPENDSIVERAGAKMEEEVLSDLVSPKSLRCDVCGITCPYVLFHIYAKCLCFVPCSSQFVSPCFCLQRH